MSLRGRILSNLGKPPAECAHPGAVGNDATGAIECVCCGVVLAKGWNGAIDRTVEIGLPQTHDTPDTCQG